MSYMDQGMDCKLCRKEHSQFSTGVCLDCEFKEREAKLKAEWDSKTPMQKAIHYLEKWADPQAMTFSKHDAKFVLGVVKSLAAPAPVLPAAGGDAGRYQRLRILGVAPFGTPQLTSGTVLRFQNLDALVDGDIAQQPSRGEYQPVGDGQAEVEDPVVVSRGLLGAACHAIVNKVDAPNTLEKLRSAIYAQPSTVQGEAKPSPHSIGYNDDLPSFSRDPDGDLALDWSVGDASLSVSFSATGLVSWATGVEGKSACGSQQVAQRAGSGEAKPVLFFKDASSSIWIETDSLAWLDSAEPIYRKIFETRTLYTAPPAAVQPDSVDIGLLKLALEQKQFQLAQAEARIAELEQPDSGRDAALEIIARAIWNVRREEEDRCDMELEDMGEDHPVWTEARAVSAAMAAQQGEQAPAAK